MEVDGNRRGASNIAGRRGLERDLLGRKVSLHRREGGIAEVRAASTGDGRVVRRQYEAAHGSSAGKQDEGSGAEHRVLERAG